MINERHHCACSTEKTFLQDFLEILKHPLQNFLKEQMTIWTLSEELSVSKKGLKLDLLFFILILIIFLRRSYSNKWLLEFGECSNCYTQRWCCCSYAQLYSKLFCNVTRYMYAYIYIHETTWQNKSYVNIFHFEYKYLKKWSF